MLDFITKYWIEFAFGIIVSGLGFTCRKIWNLYQNEKNHQRNDEQEAFYKSLENIMTAARNESKADDKHLQDQLDIIKEDSKALKIGILSLQGRQFKEDCRVLLKDDHGVITLQEYEDICKDHDAYNGLGGNHEGDYLFSLIEKKMEHHV